VLHCGDGDPEFHLLAKTHHGSAAERPGAGPSPKHLPRRPPSRVCDLHRPSHATVQRRCDRQLRRCGRRTRQTVFGRQR
jgi:hypothetical protein